MNLFRRFPKHWTFIRPILLVDLGLFVTAFLLFATEHIVLFFHIIFVLLSIGAFFWNFRAFTIRSLFWVGETTAAVLLAVQQGRTQAEEMIDRNPVALYYIGYGIHHCFIPRESAA